MERPKIEAEIRSDRGKNAARRVRMAGHVPGVLYGAGAESLALTLEPRQILAALHSHTGHNTIFELSMKNGDSCPAMVVEEQYEPVKGKLLHLDLKRIALDRKLRVSVPIVTTGEAKGVKIQGGILEVVTRLVEIECLPSEIPDHIAVAVDELMIGEPIRLGDLQKGLGEKVSLVGDAHAVICHVVAPAAEEVAPVVGVAAEAGAEPEVIKKGKAGEEGEEGAAEAEKAEKSEKPEKSEKGEKKKK
jgi:large subunit ribosomal protein L25